MFESIFRAWSMPQPLIHFYEGRTSRGLTGYNATVSIMTLRRICDSSIFMRRL